MEPLRPVPRTHPVPLLALLCLIAAGGCNDDGLTSPEPCPGGCPNGLDLPDTGANVVAKWHDLGRLTILPAGSPGGVTASERIPSYDLDMPMLTLAMYEAVNLVTNRYAAYVPGIRAELQATIPADNDTAQQQVVNGAACGILLTLFPSRSAVYAAECAASSGTDAAAASAFQFGGTVAAKVIAWRGDDGRETALPPWSSVASTEPGQFRSLNPDPAVNPVNYVRPHVKPFSLTSAAQVRAPAPHVLGSAAYVSDLEETRQLGAVGSTTRTEAQTENAKFHTMPPPLFWMTNYQRFATSQPTLVENARLMAALWVTLGDATTACFEAKYFYRYWRPVTAIRLADLDGNLNTLPDPAWTAVVGTPNHPEYPAAHGCLAGATAAVLRNVFSTTRLRFTFSTEVASVQPAYRQQHYASTDDFEATIAEARIAGGMHFRNATVQGQEMGRAVAAQVLGNHFQPR